MKIDKVEALHSLRPRSLWSLEADVLNWQDSNQTEPTEPELDAEVKRLQADYDAKKYQRDRAVSYPPLAEQMDLLYHGGLDALKTELKKTKDKYPKPT